MYSNISNIVLFFPGQSSDREVKLNEKVSVLSINPMKKAVYNAGRLTLLLLSLLSPFLSAITNTVEAAPDLLRWSTVDTPSDVDNVIISPSEVNSYAIGPDGETVYAVDVPGDLGGGGIYSSGKLYKSDDGGISWNLDATDSLIEAGAFMPVWNVTTAPDDANLIAAITSGGLGGPAQIYFSKDGGANWQFASAGITLAAGEFLSSIDISALTAGGLRYIATGTRSGAASGTIWTLKYVPTGLSTWADQSIAPSTGWTAADVIDVKFSPNYTSDSSITAITANALGMHIYLGSHDLIANDTDWKTNEGYPVFMEDVNYVMSAGISPDHTRIITAQLDLPEDFLGTNSDMRIYYLCTDSVAANTQAGIYRVDDTEVHRINPATSLRVSSIDYYGTLEEGILLAGEVTVDPGQASAQVWRTETPTQNAPVWNDAERPPTGGANSGYANAQVMWGPDGDYAYCGTSSAPVDLGGLPNWPFCYLSGARLDESAFSVSPYSPAYATQLSLANKDIDTETGDLWNQLSIIDTELSRLSDSASVQTRTGEGYDVLYMSSLNTNGAVAFNFDSIWRNSSGGTGRHWERILCIDSSDSGIVLRINPRTHYEDISIGNRSNTIVAGDRGTASVFYSSSEGQIWFSPASMGVPATIQIVDITLSNEGIMHVLSNDGFVYTATLGPFNWSQMSIPLDNFHTISSPMKNPDYEGEERTYEDWIVIGSATTGRSAYVDLTDDDARFTVLPPVPVTGNVYIIFDEQFEINGYLYSASNDIVGNRGEIYRWEMDESTRWDILNPINRAFYGLAQRNRALYGLWNRATPPENPPGADRTLDPRINLVHPPEWDSLTQGLPEPGDINFPVRFNDEPQALHISSDGVNNKLWAIDNRIYNFTNKIGCLWMYEDNMVTLGPWTTSPFSGQFLPADPVTGRADEINFQWRELLYGHGYQFQLSKNEDFSMIVMDLPVVIPPDPLAPSWIYYPDSIPSLETNHTYFWRVRARSATTGEIIRSPWSAIMYFTVNAGLPVTAEYMGPRLLFPNDDCGCRCNAPVCFSWSPFKETTAYRFELSENADMSSPLVSVEVPTTAYRYDGLLKCNTNYFWRVMSAKPYYSEWSTTFSFMTRSTQEQSLGTLLQTRNPTAWLTGSAIIYILLLAGIVIIFFKFGKR